MLENGRFRRVAVALVTPKYPPIASGYGNQAFGVNNILMNSINMILLTQDRDPVKVSLAHQDAEHISHRTKNYSVIDMFLWSMRSCLWLISNRSSYDIIHILGAYFWALPFVLIGRLLAKPTVVKVISGEIDLSVRDTLLRRIRLHLLRWASVLVVLTEYALQSAMRVGFAKEQLRRIPNGVDIERYSNLVKHRASLRERMKLSADCFVVLFVGQIGVRKGVDRLLLAWQEFQRMTEIPSLLILVGEMDGSIPPNEILKSSHVHIVGHVKDPSPYYAVADCFVLLSRREGMANVLLEAAAAGLPFIVSDIPPNRELAAWLNGCVVPGDDSQMALRAAQQLVRFAHVRTVEKAYESKLRLREKVRTEFSLESVASRYAELYRELRHSVRDG